MKVLVTGSRGYIGSVVVKTLQQQGIEAFGIDINPRPNGSAVYGMYSEANINEEIIADIAVQQGYDTIFHLAASADVGDSVANPHLYYENNVGNTATFFKHLLSKGWRGKFIFSSTAAVYEERANKVYETSPIGSPNPYGVSKYACEEMLRAINQSHGIDIVIFRYFNVAGAWDVADAHLHAAKFLADNPGCYTFNLGTGRGVSNSEMLNAFKRFTGKHVKSIVASDRPGDPDYLVAGADKFMTDTGFRYRYSSLESIIDTAWTYYCNKMENK